MNTNTAPSAQGRPQAFFAALVRGFHRYATWLVGISWWRFFLLSLLLMILAGVLSELPPFSWKTTHTVVDSTPSGARDRPTHIKIGADRPGKGVNIHIGDHGIQITESPDDSASDPKSSATPPPAAPAAPPQAGAPGKDQGKAKDSDDNDDDDEDAASPVRVRTVTTRFGDALPEIAALWVLASLIVKITYRGQLRAEAQAAQANDHAEAEALRRQVAEARMAAMQAQVEPHFLFNTLASIDHLIETDPPRASRMQKNLIALLRASMPTLREQGGSLRGLGSELAVVRPYLEILKVRMDERLDARIDVPDGLLSAAFPPMMLQSLVENAVKHGLEPKPEGGSLQVKAEIVDGQLVVAVADTGLGFGQGQTQGTSVGLNNIRERLHLLYGDQGRLVITPNTPAGTIATIRVPYRSLGSPAPAVGGAA